MMISMSNVTFVFHFSKGYWNHRDQIIWRIETEQRDLKKESNDDDSINVQSYHRRPAILGQASTHRKGEDNKEG